jgi:hypothetical protein
LEYRADHRVVLDDQLVVRQQMQHRVLQDLHPRADPHRAMGVPDDLHARADQRAFADDHVAGDLRRVEQQGASANRRGLVTVGVQRSHAFSCSHRPVHGRARVVGQVGLMLAQHRQPLTVGVRGRPDDVGRAPDQDRAGRDHGVRRDQRALAQDAAVAQPGARHQDRAVADLAQVADGSADDRGAVTENGALTHLDRMPGRADHHPVLQDGRVVANAHRGAVGPHHQALRQDRAGADVYVTQHHRRAGYFGLGLVNEKLIEAHGGLTVLLPRMLADLLEALDVPARHALAEIPRPRSPAAPSCPPRLAGQNQRPALARPDSVVHRGSYDAATLLRTLAR